jgi:transposase-like protein
MGRKTYKAEEIIAHLREVEVRQSRGESIAAAVKAIGVTDQTYYRWRREYGELKVDQAKRLKALEKENQRLRKAVSDLTLDKMILAEAAKGAEGQRQQNF